MGPLPPNAIKGVEISGFGLIPKRTPGEWRLLIDLSSPDGASVNDRVHVEVAAIKN